MQRISRPTARTAAAAVLLAAGVAGCVTPAGPGPARHPDPSAAAPPGSVRRASYQQEGSDEEGGVGEFFDPLLDAPAGDAGGGGDAGGTEGADVPARDDAPPTPDAAADTAAAVDAPPAIGLDEAVSRAVARSPRAAAARRRADAVAARLPQVVALEDPTVSSTSYLLPGQALQTAAGRVQTGVQLAQRFPWPDKLDARGEVVRREYQAALTEVQSAELAAALAARTAWLEAWYAGRAVGITERNRDLLEQLADVAVARVRTGGGQTDVLRARLEIDRLDDRLLTLRRAEDVARADLAAALRLPPGAPLPTAADDLPPLDPAAEVDALFAAARRCRPELRRLTWEIAAGRARRDLACLAGRPDFTAGLGYTVLTEENALAGVANGRDNVSVLFGMTLPVYRDKVAAGIAEADRRIAADARALDAETDETLRLIRRLAVRLETLDDQLALLDDRILPRAERTLEVSLADYRGDRVGFSEVANSYADILRAEVQRARLRADIGVALAELERAVGCDLAAVQPHAAVPVPAPPPEPLPGALDAPPPLMLDDASEGEDRDRNEDEPPAEPADADPVAVPVLPAEPAAFTTRPADRGPAGDGWRKARPRAGSN